MSGSGSQSWHGDPPGEIMWGAHCSQPVSSVFGWNPGKQETHGAPPADTCELLTAAHERQPVRSANGSSPGKQTEHMSPPMLCILLCFVTQNSHVVRSKLGWDPGGHSVHSEPPQLKKVRPRPAHGEHPSFQTPFQWFGSYPAGHSKQCTPSGP